MSRQEDFKKNRARLERLIGTCNSEAWKAIEKIATAEKQICERMVMRADHANFQKDALDVAHIRGEHKVWSWLAAIRENAPVELAAIEAELGKEKVDGEALQQTGKE